MGTSGATINAHAVAGLHQGTRREALRQSDSNPAGDAQLPYKQQDRSIAVAARRSSGDTSADQKFGTILTDLAQKNAEAPSSAAIALAHIEVRDVADGRELTVDAASMGDCDVFVAVSPADGSAPVVKRLFDNIDFPEQFDEMALINRRINGGIGADSDPEAIYQRHRIKLKQGETATIFTATDGYWDGHAVLARSKADGLAPEQAQARVKGRIGDAVRHALATDDDSAMAASLTERLLAESEQRGLAHTDNISATAAVIRSEGKAPDAFIIGSIDGAGEVGPTEKMVDGIVTDIQAKLGPSLLSGNDNRHGVGLPVDLGQWREHRQQAVPPKAVTSTPALGKP